MVTPSSRPSEVRLAPVKGRASRRVSFWADPGIAAGFAVRQSRGYMQGGADVQAVAHVIQLSVAPVFLMAGVSGLLSVLTNRLGRIIDRARVIEQQLETAAPEERAHRHERLEVFSKRARLMNTAISLCTACAAMVCLVIMALFGGTFLELDLSRVVAVLFVGAMASLFSALMCFLREVILATRSLRIGGTTK